MKVFACLLICCYLIYSVSGERLLFHGRRLGGNLMPPPPSQLKSANVLELRFDQILDHSDPTNLVTWKQKYHVNDEYFDKEKRNLAFLMIGGEGPASAGWMTSGTWTKNAKLYNALMFQLEHRFYGDSHPFNDTSIEHLKYLSSEQALDDLANFIVAMNKQYDLAPDVKWVAFGGSYSGSLAAWLRMKYPHLVFAASSSSGPLEAIVDFQEYLTVVANDLRDLHSQECADVVEEGFRQLEASLEEDPAKVDELFNLCTPVKDSLNDSNSIGNFMEIIADNFAYVAQYNKASNEYTVEKVCEILTNSSTPEIERLAQINRLIGGDSCMDITWESMIEEMRNDSLNGVSTTSGMRQWMYQTCTEFGFYQTSTAEPHVFGTKFPIEFFVNLCADAYNANIDLEYLNQVIDRTNAIYGAKNIDVSKVIFIHGTVDPWHPLGIYQSNNPAAPAILVPGTSHCADMYEPTPQDPEQLELARQKVTAQLGAWLKQ